MPQLPVALDSASFPSMCIGISQRQVGGEATENETVIPEGFALDGKVDTVTGEAIDANLTLTIQSLVISESNEVELILGSGLFDQAWYLRAYPDVAACGVDPILHFLSFGGFEGRNPGPSFDTKRYQRQHGAKIVTGLNPLVHYIRYGHPDDLIDAGLLDNFSKPAIRTGMERLEACPLFSADDYASLNSDVDRPEINKLNHAMVYGFPEGRRVFRADVVARVLGSSGSPKQPPRSSRSRQRGPSSPASARIGVFYNSEGNVFIRDLAYDLVAHLISLGAEATLFTEKSGISARPPICIFVAPHEFFHLGQGKAWVREDVICNAWMFNTEQPQTLWFERGMPFILMAKGVIDICDQMANIFQKSGLPSAHFNPSLQPAPRPNLTKADKEHALFRVLPRSTKKPGNFASSLSERQIDISFFGTSSLRRDAFFLRAAAFFADYRCYLYYRRFDSAIVNSKRDGILEKLPLQVAMHSKIVLNIHRDDVGFFEWHRIVKLGLACGSIVVSEPCLPHPLLRPGVHYFEEAGRQIPNLIEWLLRSEDGLKKMEEVRQAVSRLVESPQPHMMEGEKLIALLNHNEVPTHDSETLVA